MVILVIDKWRVASGVALPRSSTLAIGQSSVLGRTSLVIPKPTLLYRLNNYAEVQCPAGQGGRYKTALEGECSQTLALTLILALTLALTLTLALKGLA